MAALTSYSSFSVYVMDYSFSMDSLAVEIAAIKAKCPDVVIIDNPRKHGWKTSMAWHRKFKCIQELSYGYKLAVIPKYFHDYSMLIRYFRGSVVRMVSPIKSIRLNLKVNCANRDRMVNKRKTFLKSLITSN
jgi:hypothetical protein